MKLYIKNYTPIDIFTKIKLLDDYYVSTKNNIEIVSDDGMFFINEKKFYKMNIILDKLVELRSNDLELLLDKSVYKNEIVYHLPLNHINTYVTSFNYAISPKSKIKLVIEGKYEFNENENSIDNEKIITNKYYNFTPINFYFELQNEITDFEILNNDDLNVFLSVLN